uniref:Uncharacterized protein n=1 Tax=Salix viminalis TaxID=40686 RepID=A0A6N2KGK7_SALVM
MFLLNYINRAEQTASQGDINPEPALDQSPFPGTDYAWNGAASSSGSEYPASSITATSAISTTISAIKHSSCTDTARTRCCAG